MHPKPLCFVLQTLRNSGMKQLLSVENGNNVFCGYDPMKSVGFLFFCFY